MPNLSVILILALLSVSCATKSEFVPNKGRNYEACRSIEKCMHVVHDVVSRNWIYPHDEVYGLEAMISVHLDLDGKVQSAFIVDSSGDESFDRSIEDAVYRSSPFSELIGLDVDDFQRYFGSFKFKFRPSKT